MLEFLIHSAVEFHARERPDHPAFAFGDQRLSYAELDAAANRFARTLVAQGLRPGDRVGLFLHKGLELAVALYGSLKAGGVFVPLDPFLPAERLAFLLADCGICHLASSDALAKPLGVLAGLARERGLTLPTVYGPAGELPLETVPWPAIETAQSAPPGVVQVDRDLAYLMYTSGSTGQPKGMMHTHRGSLSYARWGALHVGLTSQDRVASHAPLHFDLSIFDLFSTALVGGTVVLVPEPVTKFPASWTQLVQDARINVVFTVPYTLIEMLQRGAMDKRDLSSLRWILFGGEPFPPKHLRLLMAALPGVCFTNVYGPAEAPSCTCYDVPALAEGDDEPLPIGELSRNSAGLIVDEDGHECPVETPGELCIRSSTLTRGYWNRPDLNAKAFLLREGYGPFPEPWYRTGDVVVRGEDGLLRFLGRRDRMVKTRGHRVELDEVEAALARDAAVAEAAAFTVPDGEGSRAILAAATARPGADLSPEGLLRHARDLLPAYAVPRRVLVLDELPRTSGGKIDRRRLSETNTLDPDA